MPAAAAEAAAPLVGPLAVKFLAVGGPVAAQVLFLAPMATMRQFKQEGTTGDVSVLPYAAMAANGLTWTAYGALAGFDLTIMLPNASGALLGLYYSHTFYAHRSEAATVAPYFGGAATFSAAVAAMALALPPADARSAIGYAGVGVCFLMFSGPLAAISTVLRQRSAASIPLPMAAASAVNCTLWTSYGALVVFDPFIVVPNALGLGAALAQLGLIARFGQGPPPAPPAPPARPSPPAPP